MPKPPDFINKLGFGGKVPKNIVKNAGAPFGQGKEATSAKTPETAGTDTAPPASPSTPIPFKGFYEAIVGVEYVDRDWANSKFVAGTTAESSIELEGNGQPLILPLSDFHPGFCGELALNVGAFFDIWTRVAADDGRGCKEWYSRWNGSCDADGSHFIILFEIASATNPIRRTFVGGRVEGTRSTES